MTHEYSLSRWQRAVVAARKSGVITPSAMFTALLLETFADYGTGRNACPAADTLADLQGVKRDTIYRNLVILRQAGLVDQTRRGGGLNGLPSRFDLVIPETNSGDTAPQKENSGGNSGGNSGADRDTTSFTSFTSKDTYDTYAPNRRLGQGKTADETIYLELVDGLNEAITDQYVSLPKEDSEFQAEAILDSLLPALSVVGIDKPLPYLNAILRKDGTYVLGLAVREMWRAYVTENTTDVYAGKAWS